MVILYVSSDSKIFNGAQGTKVTKILFITIVQMKSISLWLINFDGQKDVSWLSQDLFDRPRESGFWKKAEAHLNLGQIIICT